MKDNDSNTNHNPDNKDIFIQSRLENVLKIIEHINSSDFQNAQSLVQEYKGSTEFESVNTLVQTAISHSQNTNTLAVSFLRMILDRLPFPVFIKDEEGRYLVINVQEVQLFGIPELEIIGKQDADFVKDAEELDIIRKSDTEVLVAGKTVELPNQSFTLPNGRSYVFKTHKIPFINPFSGKPNVLGFSVDMTDTVNFDKLKKILVMNSPFL